MDGNGDTGVGLLKVPVAAKRCGISERLLWDYVHSGDLPAARFGRAYRIDLRDLEAFIERHKKGGR